MADVLSDILSDIIVFVIVHPKIPERKEQVEHELRRAHFDDFFFIDGTTTDLKDVSVQDACIINSHLVCFSHYVSLRSTKHLLILEDDVEFLTERPLVDIKQAVDSIHGLPWYSLHIGHFPLGPSIPINLHVAWTFLPFTSHAILWNASRVRSVLSKARHGRPYVIEGNMHLPLFSRYAMLKSIVTQNRRPKELKYLDENSVLGKATRQFHFSTWNDAFRFMSVTCPLLVIAFLVSAFRKNVMYIPKLVLIVMLIVVVVSS